MIILLACENNGIMVLYYEQLGILAQLNQEKMIFSSLTNLRTVIITQRHQNN
jgi:hypothetical protein